MRPLLLLHYLCFVTLFLRQLVKCTITDDDEVKRIQRAIDGSRGRKYFVPEDDGLFDSYGSSDSEYDPYDDESDLSDIRKNVPGEPGVDYPSFTRLPETEFVCEKHFRGYYADQVAGCQVFHVCDGSFLVSSFLCPVGSIFSQKLLTCDWWSNVDCSATRNYYAINSESLVSEVDDDEILRKAFEMESVQSSGERIPIDTVIHQQEQQQEQQQRQQQQLDNRKQRVLSYGGRAVTERSNDLRTETVDYNSDYADYSNRFSSRYKSTNVNRQLDDYYTRQVDEQDKTRLRNNPAIRVHTIGEDRNNDRPFALNEFERASYAPTVPTVTTTMKRFYSPTIPTTFRTSTVRNSKYDLEFESSDHLYTARGRSEETIKAATPPTLSNRVENPRTRLPSRNVSLATFVNAMLDERQDDNENIEKSKSSNYHTALPIHHSSPAASTRASSSITEAAPPVDDSQSSKISETLSILTIDNDHRDDPDVYSYNQHDKGEETLETSTTIESFSTLSVIDTTESPTSSTYDSSSFEKPTKFLVPPKENALQFRIMIPEGNDNLNLDTQIISKNNFTSPGAVHSSVKVPIAHITPALPSPTRKEDKESPIFRIVINRTADINVESAEPMTDHERTILLSNDFKPNSTFARDFSDSKIISLNLTGRTGGSPILTPPQPIARLTEDNNTNKSEVSTGIEEIRTSHQRIDDSLETASSPIEAILSVNNNEELDRSGDGIRRLVANQGGLVSDSLGAADYKSFEIVKSDDHEASSQHRLEDTTYFTTNDNKRALNDQQREAIRFNSNGVQQNDFFRNIVRFTNGQDLPRPFSLERPPPQNVDFQASPNFYETALSNSAVPLPVKFESDEPDRLENWGEKDKLDEDASRGSAKRKINRPKLILDLPQSQRTIDFQSARSAATQFQHADEARLEDELIDDQTNTTQRSLEKLYEKSVIETEFIPSLSFSLNTEEERTEYMQAVMKGLLPDVRASTELTDHSSTTADTTEKR